MVPGLGGSCHLWLQRFSARGFERIKDGDEIPVGWFDELTIDKMIKKGTIVVIQPEQEKQEIIEEIEIPKLADRPARTSSDDEPRKPYGRASSGSRDSGKPRRGFDNPGGERRGAPRGR